MKKRVTNTTFSLKKILFIVPYPIGEAPSQRFRFEQYLDILTEHNFQYDMAPFWSQKAWSILYSKGHIIIKSFLFLSGLIKRFFLLFKVQKYQLIFLHREALPIGSPIIEFIIAKILQKKIIYDFDDAIWLPNTSEQNSIIAKVKFHNKVASICKWSWKVSCGNDFLADYAKKFNDQVVINPTTIDTSYHIPKKVELTDQSITVGWTGTHSTLKYLDKLLPLFEELKHKFLVNIMIISNQKPSWDFNDYQFVMWDKADEILQLNKIDIGIMPLDDTVWEQGKCGFKALQYMALEIPAVVSKVGVNKTIIQHGKNGYLCNDINDWHECLTQLISSEILRKSIGAQGRKRVIEDYSVRSNADLFLSLFE